MALARHMELRLKLQQAALITRQNERNRTKIATPQPLKGHIWLQASPHFATKLRAALSSLTEQYGYHYEVAARRFHNHIGLCTLRVFFRRQDVRILRSNSRQEAAKDLRPIAVSPLMPMKCERQELNLHPLRDWILSPARLPVPPLSHVETLQ